MQARAHALYRASPSGQPMAPSNARRSYGPGDVAPCASTRTPARTRQEHQSWILQQLGFPRPSANIPALPFCHVTLSASKPKENYPKCLQTLGDHLKKRRLDLKLLKREVAEVLGVCPETITLWEENQTTVEVRYLPRIMDFLGYCPYAPAHTLGEQLVAWQTRALGLSRKQAAKRLHMDERTLARWETGETRPSEEAIERFRRMRT